MVAVLSATLSAPILAQELAVPAAPETERPEQATPPPKATSFSSSRGPRPHRRNGEFWITDVDYPAISWRNGEIGEVDYRLDVDATGKPTSCLVTKSSGHARLDELTCELLMERASFEPAYDENREKVAGVYEFTQVWSRAVQPIEEGFEVKMTAVMGPTMDAATCTLDWSGDVPDNMIERFRLHPCPFPDSFFKEIPFRDENGEPISKRVTFTYRLEISDIEQDDQ